MGNFQWVGKGNLTQTREQTTNNGRRRKEGSDNESYQPSLERVPRGRFKKKEKWEARPTYVGEGKRGTGGE